MPEYKLPDVGEGLTEAEIVAWKVKVGDVVAINDIVVEIETAKSIVELPSPYAGTGDRAAGRRGRDGRRRHADHRDRRPDGAAPAARADLGEIDLSNPAASGGGEGESPGRPQQGRPRPDPPRAQGGVRCGGRAHADAGRVRDRRRADGRGRRGAGAVGPRRRRAASRRPPPYARWRSRRCASWPRTSASTSRR